MIGDKKEIQAGDSSTNIQGNKVTVVNNGLSYTEVKEVFMDLFKNNFYELGEKASQVARERAEQITNVFLEKLQNVSPEAINNTTDPDVRYAIYTVQKEHARLGNEDIANLLIDVLVNRTKVVDDSLVKIVLNESLEVIPKLTLRQIDALTFLFLVRNVSFSGNLNEFIKLLIPFSSSLSLEPSFYQHLQYAGCISISIGEHDLDNAFKKKFPIDLDNKNIAEELIKIEPEMEKVQQYWKESFAKNSTLTSVGTAIAHANFVSKTGINADLSIWIKE